MPHLAALGAVRAGPTRARVWRNVWLPPATPVSVFLRPREHAALPPPDWQPLVAAGRDYVVLDKPPGLPTIATRDNAAQCVLAEARAWLPAPLQAAPLLVTSRLDLGTHGLLFFARTADAQRAFNAHLASGKAHKRYAAVVRGWTAGHLRLLGGPLRHFLADATEQGGAKLPAHPVASPTATGRLLAWAPELLRYASFWL